MNIIKRYISFSIVTTTSPSSSAWGSIIGTLSDQTDLQDALDTKFARTDGTLLGVVSPAYAAGKLVWNSTTDILEFMNSNSMVRLQIGHELWTRVYNNSGSSIANGKAVYVNGTDAGTGLETVALAKADALATMRAIGLSTQTIANGSVGLVTSFGRVNDLDTTAFAANTVLYVSTSVAGDFQTTEPVYPNYAVRIGRIVVVNAVTGVIQVTPPTYRNITPNNIFFTPRNGSGRYILPQALVGSVSQANLSANQLRAYPYIVSETVIITGFSFVVSSGVGSTEFRVGLFTNIISGGLHYPESLIANSDIQVFSSAANGNVSGSFSSAITLSPGLYWIVYNSNGAAQMRTINPANLPMINGISGGNIGGNSTEMSVGWQISTAYNAAGITTPFPAGATFQGGTATQFMMVRLAV